MGVILKLQKTINKSNVIRKLVAPGILVKRKIEEAVFFRSEDSEVLRNLRNTHEGERCFVIGNGPSLTAEDLSLIKNEFSFACNRIYNIFDKTEWRPNIYMCGDRQCLFDEIENIKKLKGCKKFVATYAKKYGRKPEDELNYYLISGKYQPRIEKLYMHEISVDVSNHFTSSQTVTTNAIEFAIYMGFKEIYLLGIDHNYPISIDKDGKKTVDSNVKSHFDNGGSKEASLHYIYYDAATACYQTCEDYARNHGIKIYNSTRGGKLEVFERIKLEDAVRNRKMLEIM